MNEMEGIGGDLGKVRSGVAKGTSGAAKAGAMGSKAKARGGKTFLRVLVMVLLGLLLGALSLIDPFGAAGVRLSRLIFFSSTAGSLLIGIWLAPKPEEGNGLWAHLGSTCIAALGSFAGMVLGHLLLPGLFTMGSSAFTWVVTPTAVAALLPTLIVLTFRAAVGFSPKRYDLWYYPKNYREQQHTWNRDRIVIANFHFKRKQQEDLITTVNVKLPEDAELGELIYLFIKDYNENRFPNAPITNLRTDDGKVGWLFRKPRYVFRKQRKLVWSQAILDPKLTIGQNGITRDSDVYFDRVIQENAEA